jgi:nucleotide-binding universal stress UspA family protein
MADSTGRRPIVVGFDKSGHSEMALDWAISEATARSRPLHLIHALETTVTVWSPMMAVPQDLDDQSWVLDAARRRVGETAPDLDVTSALTAGPASAALVTASKDADTLVVGARGHGVVANILLESTSLKVAGHASCPVVVVRGTTSATPTNPTVVVGFDGSDLSMDALGYAFAAAAQRGLPLDVVTSWEPDLLSTYRLSPGVAEKTRAAAAAHQKEIAVSAASPWREKHPSVEVRIHVTTDSPAQSLIARSADAALVVVGSRGLGSVRGPLLGSVSGAVLRHAESPVVIVRPATAGEPHESES